MIHRRMPAAARRLDLLADLDARGLIHDTTDRDALAARLAEGPITLYYGCDPTADSLHVGNLIGLLVLRRFAEAATARSPSPAAPPGWSGDPGGRREERNLLDEATLRANVAAIKEQIAPVLGATGRLDAGRQLDWTARARAARLPPRRRQARHRQPDGGPGVGAGPAWSPSTASATPSSRYMLLQANDYRWLHEHEGCELQIGGSDQWGNILSGVDLIRRTTGAAVHALCWPLLTAPDGTKLGKTTGARVWLSPERTSPYRVLPALDARPTTPGRRVSCAEFTLLPLAEIDGRRRRPRGGARAAAGPAPPGPARSRRSCTGPTDAAAAEAAAARAVRRPRRSRPTPPPSRPSPPRCPPTAVAGGAGRRRAGRAAGRRRAWRRRRARPAACSPRAACGSTARSAGVGRRRHRRRAAPRALRAAAAGQDRLPRSSSVEPG